MKKIFIFIIFCFLGFIGLNVVKADEYTCSYYNEAHNVQLKMSIIDDKISFKHDLNPENVDNIMDYLILSSEETKDLNNQITSGNCQKTVIVCKGQRDIGSDFPILSDEYAVLFNLQYESDAHNFSGGDFKKIRFGGNNECIVLEIDKDNSSGKIVDLFVPGCKDVDDKFPSLTSLYKKCDDTHLDACDEYKIKKNELYSYCSSLLQFGNYTNPCVTSCLNINDKISQIENVPLKESTCGMSDRIIRWIANIVKWVKYIAPVLVIILGILDFIKAFASGNDDEMKKVKARFVKRLISAALLFIVPFIIEFVLDVFNLVTDNPYCNLF